jgi:hypothetical protein
MSLHLYNAAAAQGLSCYKHLTTVKKPVNILLKIVSHNYTLLNAIQLDANRHYPTLIDATPRSLTPLIRQAIQSSTVFVIN